MPSTARTRAALEELVGSEVGLVMEWDPDAVWQRGVVAALARDGEGRDVVVLREASGGTQTVRLDGVAAVEEPGSRISFVRRG